MTQTQVSILFDFGLCMQWGPWFLMRYNGIGDEADAVRWLMKRPLQTILALKAMIEIGQITQIFCFGMQLTHMVSK